MTNDELGMDAFIFQEGFCVMGGYMNNVTTSNYTDLVFMAINVDSTNSIEELDQMELSIYPNPASEIISINCDEKINSIEIFNLQGQKVYFENKLNQTVLQIDVKDLKPGLYIINCSFDECQRRKFFIKN